MINLPIDVVGDSRPPKFRWRQIIDTAVGPRTVDHEGTLPPNVEDVVAALVGIVRQLEQDNMNLRVKIAAPPIVPPAISLKKVKG